MPGMHPPGPPAEPPPPMVGMLWLLVMISGVLFIALVGALAAKGLFDDEWMGSGGIGLCAAPAIVLGVLHFVVAMGVRGLKAQWWRGTLVVLVLGIVFALAIAGLMVGVITGAESSDLVRWDRVYAGLVPSVLILVAGFLNIVLLLKAKPYME